MQAGIATQRIATATRPGGNGFTLPASMPAALAWIAASALSPAVHAQQTQGLVLNGDLSMQTDSNVLKQNQAVGDQAAILSPSMLYRNDFSKHRLVMTYEGILATYLDNDRWSYDSHSLGATAQLTHTYPFSSELAAGYQDTIEQPGLTNAAMDSLNELNQLKQSTVQAKFNTGTTQSIGQIVLALAHNERNYTNNAQEFRDVDQDTLTGTFFYRTGAKTRLLFEAASAGFDYRPGRSANNQSSKEMRYLTGFEWSATAKTSGSARVGYQTKEFERAQFDDISGLSYALDMIWQPNTYSTLSFRANRSTNESAQLDIAGFMTTSFGIGLDHLITPRTRLGVNYAIGTHYIRSVQEREDKRRELGLNLDYQLSGWLYLGFSYRHEERNSPNPLYVFTSDRFDVSLFTRFE